jgi:hypothetical protein
MDMDIGISRASVLLQYHYCGLCRPSTDEVIIKIYDTIENSISLHEDMAFWACIQIVAKIKYGYR